MVAAQPSGGKFRTQGKFLQTTAPGSPPGESSTAVSAHSEQFHEEGHGTAAKPIDFGTQPRAHQTKSRSSALGSNAEAGNRSSRSSFDPAGRYVADANLKGTQDASKAARCYHIFGVAKSGTTWLTTLLRECKIRNCLDQDQARLSKLCSSSKGPPKGCEAEYSMKHKTDEDRIASKNGKSVFIFRDTRDVVTSSYHWSTGGRMPLREFAGSDRGVRFVVSQQNKFYSIARDRVIDHKGVIVFYEDLKIKTFDETVRIARFLRMTLTQDMVAKAVNVSSFDEMRKHEEGGELNLKVHPLSASTLALAKNQGEKAEQLFGVMTRRGKVGGWRDEMDNETQAIVETEMHRSLNEYLLRRFSE